MHFPSFQKRGNCEPGQEKKKGKKKKALVGRRLKVFAVPKSPAVNTFYTSSPTNECWHPPPLLARSPHIWFACPSTAKSCSPTLEA